MNRSRRGVESTVKIRPLSPRPLSPWDVSTATGARIGWSFANNGVLIDRTLANILARRYNHFRLGADGAPGRAGVDDDGDWVRGGPDGAPGVMGVDEDGDGRADDVTGPYATPEANRTNGLDDDGDGTIDDGPADPAGRPEPFGAGDDHDLNNNGSPDAGEPNVDEEDEFVVPVVPPLFPTDIGTVRPGTDDVDLDRDGDGISALVATGPDPTPTVPAVLIEAQADAAEPNAQDLFRPFDWANPGKNHGRELPVANGNGEMNAFSD